MADPRKPTDAEIAGLQTRFNEEVEAVRRDPERHSDVTGIDIGYVYDAKGTRTDEVAVRVHKSPKLSKRDALGASGAVSSASSPHVMVAEYLRGGMPSVIQNVQPADPIQPGMSVSNERIRGGTIGLVVSERATRKQYVLSNAHILGSAQAPNEWVIQPAMYLGGTALDPRHRLGHVHKSIDDINGDAAIATIEGRRVDRRQFRSGVLISSADKPKIGDRVEKDGMGTRVTCGFVDGFGQYYLRGPQNPMKGFRIVRGGNGQDCTADLSEHADSGSVWYRRSNASDAVGLGLHVGGDLSVADAAIRPAIACYLVDVLDQLGVEV